MLVYQRVQRIHGRLITFWTNPEVWYYVSVCVYMYNIYICIWLIPLSEWILAWFYTHDSWLPLLLKKHLPLNKPTSFFPLYDAGFSKGNFETDTFWSRTMSSRKLLFERCSISWPEFILWYKHVNYPLPVIVCWSIMRSNTGSGEY